MAKFGSIINNDQYPGFFIHVGFGENSETGMGVKYPCGRVIVKKGMYKKNFMHKQKLVGNYIL
jgi:hypothetical protein